MCELGLAGVRRGTIRRTTIRDDAAAGPTWCNGTWPPPGPISCGYAT
jgi:hypothetical protein